jgi:TRAP transporter TAXI family solute receptor
MLRSLRPFVLASSALALTMATSATAAEIELPSTVVWSAYPTGSSGYSQAVAVGNVLQQKYQVNLRVVPARNDVSRLSPLRAQRVNFSAGGSEAVYAQEGMLNFGVRDWGPQPLRVALWNISDGCSFTFATAADANIKQPVDIKGKRVTWVQGSPSLNNAMTALLSYANLSWDDVKKVEVSGYDASVDAVVDNRADVVGGSCNSASFLKIEASPRGLRFPAFPHGDQAAVSRVRNHLPWYVPHVAIDGPTIGKEGVQVFTSPYPMLVTLDKEKSGTVYNMVKAMHIHFDDYKDGAPGANGWAMDRQGLGSSFVPFHDGAVKYFKEIGLWTPAAEQRQQVNLKRQQVLKKAWDEYVKSAPADEEGFRRGWMQTRYDALTRNDLVTIAKQW